jgi:hypothetical protein
VYGYPPKLTSSAPGTANHPLIRGIATPPKSLRKSARRAAVKPSIYANVVTEFRWIGREAPPMERRREAGV